MKEVKKVTPNGGSRVNLVRLVIIDLIITGTLLLLSLATLIAVVVTSRDIPQESNPLTSEVEVTPDSTTSITTSTPPEPSLPEESKTLIETIEYKDYEVPSGNTSFKAYMDYRTITSVSSRQWAMQQEAWTDDKGLRRYKDYYMVAVGTYYSQYCGKVLEVAFDGGTTIKAIVSDIKDDAHTDDKNQYAGTEEQKNVVEFIVDTKKVEENVIVSGDISKAGMVGNVLYIKEVMSEDHSTSFR